MQEIQVQPLDQEGPLEQEMKIQLQYSCLENLMDSEAWWAIQLMGLQRVRHDSETEYAPRHTCEGKLE